MTAGAKVGRLPPGPTVVVVLIQGRFEQKRTRNGPQRQARQGVDKSESVPI